MNINFKGSYFNFKFLTESDWTLSNESMDNVQSVHGLSGHCPVRLDSLAFVQGVHGRCPDCPLSPWTMSTESMDNVHWIHGHCPVWLVSLDFVHGFTRPCPEYPWTLSRLSTESMVNVHESMDNVQGVHWVYGLSTAGKPDLWGESCRSERNNLARAKPASQTCGVKAADLRESRAVRGSDYSLAISAIWEDKLV